MIFIFFDLGLLLFVGLIIIILGALLGATLLNTILNFIFIPSIIILILVHIIGIILFDLEIYNESKSKPPFLITGITLFSIGRLLRSFLEIVYFAVLCKSFISIFQECDGILDHVFFFIVFLLGLLEGFFIFFISALIDAKLIDNYHPALFIGIVSLLLSIIFYILVEGWAHPLFAELFVDTPILNSIFRNPSILDKILLHFFSD